jgi:hypothetical protein
MGSGSVQFVEGFYRGRMTHTLEGLQRSDREILKRLSGFQSLCNTAGFATPTVPGQVGIIWMAVFRLGLSLGGPSGQHVVERGKACRLGNLGCPGDGFSSCSDTMSSCVSSGPGSSVYRRPLMV